MVSTAELPEMAEEQTFLWPVELGNQAEIGGMIMKRLSMFLALSALLASATAAQAQCVSASPCATSTTVVSPAVVAAPATVVAAPVAVTAAPLAGTVLVADTSVREIPIGVNEIGRYARYMGDHRFLSNEIEFSNRDFQAYKATFAPSSRNYAGTQLRGLGASMVAPDLPARRVGVINLTGSPAQLYF